jgi:hypothetical protein
MARVWRSPFPDVAVPEREDLYEFLLGRAARAVHGRRGDGGSAGVRPDQRTWQPAKAALIDGTSGAAVSFEARRSGAGQSFVWSYRGQPRPSQELKRAADRLGDYLAAAPLALWPGDVVAVLCPNHIEYGIVLLGAFRLGRSSQLLAPRPSAVGRASDERACLVGVRRRGRGGGDADQPVIHSGRGGVPAAGRRRPGAVHPCRAAAGGHRRCRRHPGAWTRDATGSGRKNSRTPAPGAAAVLSGRRGHCGCPAPAHAVPPGGTHAAAHAAGARPRP